MGRWIEINNSLVRECDFNDFNEAFAYITRVALLAEQLNHHPEIWNVYNKVRITLTTHDAGNTITEKDRQMAAEIDRWEHG